MSEQPPYPPQPDPQQPYGQPGQYGSAPMPPPPPAWQPGQPAPHQFAYQPPLPTPGNATTALILGIIGMVACPLITSVPAIIIGRNAVKEIDASQGRLGGRSTAQAGFILGIIGTVIGALTVVLVVVVFALGASLRHTFNDNCSFNEGNGFSNTC